jgi:photosystem II stability/assembly factor-like uncharacterized protein
VCPSATTCIATGRDDALLRSDDAGQTWQTQLVDLPQQRTTIRGDQIGFQLLCTDSTTCLRVGDPLLTLQATSGDSWQVANATGLARYPGNLSLASCPTGARCSGVDNAGNFLVSNDGGLSWRRQPLELWTAGSSESSATLSVTKDLLCLSEMLCMAFGGRGDASLFERSEDGGYTWTAVPVSGGGLVPPVSGTLACPSPAVCYVTRDRADHVAVTHDGGASWEAAAASPTSFFPTTLACPSVAHCIVIGSHGAHGGAVIEVTRDGGSTWLDFQLSIGGPEEGELENIACPTDEECVAVDKSGTILRTTDGGASWTLATTPVTESMRSIACPSATQCIAVGDEGDIVSTTNGGESWAAAGAELPLAKDDHSAVGNAVACWSPQACIATGKSGDFQDSPWTLITTDSGITWTKPLQPPGHEEIDALACSFPGSCVGVGSCCAVTTADGGQVWSGFPIAGFETLTGVACAAALQCIAVGEDGAVETTADGGMNWVLQTSSTNQNLNAITCMTTAQCIVVGDAGIVLTSLDGGTTWTTVTSTLSSALLSIACTPDGTCFAVGEHGVILASTDAERSWQAQNSGVPMRLEAIACPTLETCFVAGDAGTVLATTDGGTTWTRLPVYPRPE